MLCTLGCLRRGAAVRLLARYRLHGQRVVFDPASNVKVLYNDERREFYIQLQVDHDKNVRVGDSVFAFVPAHIPGLAVRPVDVLLDYLRRVRPPSGGYLLSAPRFRSMAAATAKSFHSSAFGRMQEVFRAAVRRALPASSPAFLDRLGSHSGRKSLAQWLWDAYGNKRLICDVGHWKSREDAASIYFCSSRQVILDSLTRL